MYHRSRSFFDLCPRSLSINLDLKCDTGPFIFLSGSDSMLAHERCHLLDLLDMRRRKKDILHNMIIFSEITFFLD